jgi:hypothetical protein
MFLLTGIAWLLVSVLILRITAASAATVGVLIGVLFLVAMLNEWLIGAVSPSSLFRRAQSRVPPPPAGH